MEGDLLNAGTAVATIIPLDKSQYSVQIYVSNEDVANIKVGSPIRYNVLAMPSTQYGTATGVVASISQDTIIQDGQYSGYYLVEGTLDQNQLTDQNGNTASMAIGMEVQAKIVTEEKSIFQYLMEKINLF